MFLPSISVGYSQPPKTEVHTQFRWTLEQGHRRRGRDMVRHDYATATHIQEPCTEAAQEIENSAFKFLGAAMRRGCYMTEEAHVKSRHSETRQHLRPFRAELVKKAVFHNNHSEREDWRIVCAAPVKISCNRQGSSPSI